MPLHSCIIANQLFLYITGQFQLLTPQNQLVAYIGRSASFTCTVTSSTDSAGNITWTINGLQLIDSIDAVEIFNPDIAGGIGQLTINNLSLPYNGSEVNCRVHFISGAVATSNPSILIILGKCCCCCVCVCVCMSAQRKYNTARHRPVHRRGLVGGVGVFFQVKPTSYAREFIIPEPLSEVEPQVCREFEACIVVFHTDREQRRI